MGICIIWFSANVQQFQAYMLTSPSGITFTLDYIYISVTLEGALRIYPKHLTIPFHLEHFFLACSWSEVVEWQFLVMIFLLAFNSVRNLFKEQSLVKELLSFTVSRL